VFGGRTSLHAIKLTGNQGKLEIRKFAEFLLKRITVHNYNILRRFFYSVEYKDDIYNKSSIVINIQCNVKFIHDFFRYLARSSSAVDPLIRYPRLFLFRSHFPNCPGSRIRIHPAPSLKYMNFAKTTFCELKKATHLYFNIFTTLIFAEMQNLCAQGYGPG
jgi:hypothetical protein